MSLALALQEQSGEAVMPIFFSSFLSSVPGPWVGRGGHGWRLWREARLRLGRVCRVIRVDRPLIAVLADDAWHHLVERVATLATAGFEESAVAGGHGRGLWTKSITTSPETKNE
jgi:hypothetical protein